MTRRAASLLVALAATAALVAFLAVRNPRPPHLPRDADHAAWRGPDACIGCHGPGGVSPRSPNHPIGRECLRCHVSAAEP
jgi:hypothetical protein